MFGGFFCTHSLFNQHLLAIAVYVVTPCFVLPVGQIFHGLYFAQLPFGGRVEKIDSVSSSFAASSLTLALGTLTPLSFDARVIPATPGYAMEYLANRQNEAWRNHVNGYCQQVLIEAVSYTHLTL